MTQVFLSHSTIDADFALRLASDLREVGVPVWKAPESILEGERWVQAITRGVTTSTHMLILMSPASVASDWVHFEFEMALPRSMQGEMKIIPLEYQPCDLPASWAVFQTFKGLDSDYDKSLLRLIKRVNREQPAHPPPPSDSRTTIHVHIGGNAGDVTVAGGNITYRDQPAEPPPAAPVVVSEPEPEPEALVEQLTRAVLDVLPEPFAWCEIPANERFQLVTDEGDLGTFEIAPFFMAKYPVTYEQFQVFVDDPKGFGNAEWWQGLAADTEHRQAPSQQYFTHATNLPRENVSWYDAVAFCRWLSDRTGQDVHLLTEWEWQWAAQGPDGREYPWGNDYIVGYANIDETFDDTGPNYLEKTSSVGEYEQNTSPYGVMDMSGNVWEWCLNEHDNPPNTGTRGDAYRALRGGSWGDTQNYTRAPVRFWFNPDGRSYLIGFRVACSYLIS